MQEAKLDVIIPVYKIDGLEKSLMSIGTNHKVKVTIVDDGQFNDYTRIKEFFSKHFEIEIVQLEKNVGQGLARQAGLDNTNNKYVTFLDCGDMFYTPLTINDALEVMENEKIKTSLEMKVRKETIEEYFTMQVMGNFYCRDFINRFDIRFCPDDTASRFGEDNGFEYQVKIYAWITSTFTSRIEDIPSIIKESNKDSFSLTGGGKTFWLNEFKGTSINLEWALKRIASRYPGKKTELSETFYHALYNFYAKMFFMYKVENDEIEEMVSPIQRLWNEISPLVDETALTEAQYYERVEHDFPTCWRYNMPVRYENFLSFKKSLENQNAVKHMREIITSDIYQTNIDFVTEFYKPR